MGLFGFTEEALADGQTAFFDRTIEVEQCFAQFIDLRQIGHLGTAAEGGQLVQQGTQFLALRWVFAPFAQQVFGIEQDVHAFGEEDRDQLRIAMILLALAGCGKNAGVGGTAGDAEVATQKANEAMTQEFKLDDPKDFEDAKRGFIAAPEGKVMAADGTTVLIDFDAYKFIDGKAPATVNPSLWRHATLNKGPGLYKVRDGVHQLRGFDISNITLIDGKTGWIVVDALTSKESSAAALAFARKHLGNKPVTALVFTHSHADHFGGALGVVTPQEVAERKIPVIASEGFVEEATSENLMMGVAMARRATYMYGKLLPRFITVANIESKDPQQIIAGNEKVVRPRLTDAEFFFKQDKKQKLEDFNLRL